MTAVGPQGGKPYRKLGELLVAAGVIDELQLRSALAHQRQWGGRIGHILLDLHFIDDLTLASTLAEQLGLELINLRTAELEPKIAGFLPQSLAERLLVFPVRFEPSAADGGVLTLAFSDPTNLAGLDEIRFQTGKTVKAAVATEGEVAWAIRRFYYGEEDTEPLFRAPAEIPERAALFGDGSQLLGGSEEDELVELEPIPSDSQIGESAAPAAGAAVVGDPPSPVGADPLREFFTAEPPSGLGEPDPPTRSQMPDGGSVLQVDIDLRVTSPETEAADQASQSAARRPTRPDFINPLASVLVEGEQPLAPTRSAGPAVAAELDAAFERTFTLRGGTPDPSLVMAVPLPGPEALPGDPQLAGLSGQALQALIRILVRKGLVSEVEILDELQAAAAEVAETADAAPAPPRPLEQ